MMAADRVIEWTAGAVLGVAAVAAVAAVASYEYADDLVRMHGESGWTARMVPLMVDGLIYASSMVMLDSARRKTPVPALARWLLGSSFSASVTPPAKTRQARQSSRSRLRDIQRACGRPGRQ